MLFTSTSKDRGARGARTPSLRTRLRTLGAAAAGAALLFSVAGAGVGMTSGTAGASAKSPKVASGAVPSLALGIGEIFTWILPLDNQVGYEYWDIDIQRNMWLPLYYAGNGSKTGIDYTQSVGDPPVYSNHDKTVTITMKTNFKWSTGATVTSKDVKFYFQLVDAG
ncbi:MAG: hypothetical protein M0Z46_03375, partial [Actinomycetota bacterium]|nr:hypothetical protein [Actinomycetota bacterium]